MAWGLSHIAATIALHAFGVVMAAVVLARVRGRIVDRGWAFWHATMLAVAITCSPCAIRCGGC